VDKCKFSLFVFDEMVRNCFYYKFIFLLIFILKDKIPIGLMVVSYFCVYLSYFLLNNIKDTIRAYLETTPVIDGHDYRYSVFVFLR
jgi:hypothetical protein